MKTSEFDYELPQERIAQKPVEPRDHSRLMVLKRSDGSMEHRRFYQIPDYVAPGDVMVFNDSRVLPARLHGKRAGTGGKAEILLLQRDGAGLWQALVKPGKRLPPGSLVDIVDSHGDTGSRAEIVEDRKAGIKLIRFSNEEQLLRVGEVPLPPYIHQPLESGERYQTVYSRITGSAAAPTAGLHFTEELLEKIYRKGVKCLFVTLHIGLDTFTPVREEDPRQHRIHSEYGVVGREVADELSRAKREGRRIICVGTTTVRLLEQAAQQSSPEALGPYQGWADLFIMPGYRFRITDAMLTNFHLPRSTLLMLVSAFAGKEHIDAAYRQAIACGYRFYSFGDAMLIL